MKKIKMLLSHFSVSMLLGFLVLIILDGRNPLMSFLVSPASKVYETVMCAVGITALVMSIVDGYRNIQ